MSPLAASGPHDLKNAGGWSISFIPSIPQWNRQHCRCRSRDVGWRANYPAELPDAFDRMSFWALLAGSGNDA